MPGKSTLQVQIVRFRIARRTLGERHAVAADERAGEPRHDRARDLLLNREDVVDLALVYRRPHVVAVRRVDELCRDAERAPGLANAPLDDCRDAKPSSDLAHVGWLVLERECRRSR